MSGLPEERLRVGLIIGLAAPGQCGHSAACVNLDRGCGDAHGWVSASRRSGSPDRTASAAISPPAPALGRAQSGSSGDADGGARNGRTLGG